MLFATKPPEAKFVWHIRQAERHLIAALKLLYDHETIHRGSRIKKQLEKAQKALTALTTKEIQREIKFRR